MHGYRNDPAQRQLHETPDYEPTVWLTPSKKLHSVKTRPEHVRSWGVGGKGEVGWCVLFPVPFPVVPVVLVPFVPGTRCPRTRPRCPHFPVPVVEIY